jgi:hypothetical protein
MPSNAAFHPTIETVGFQTAFSVKHKIDPNTKQSAPEICLEVISKVPGDHKIQ